MSYRDFTFPEVETKLGLTIETRRLFENIPTITPRPAFLEMLAEGVTLGQGINSEKAKSEFVIAPILLEFRRLIADRHAIFSGVEFNVDPTIGLNGFCDFLITQSPRLYIVTAPVVAVAEAKNDNIVNGLGQCIATMRAAWIFNENKGSSITQIFGVSTTGSIWKFLRLRDKHVILDLEEYSIRDPGMILGILLHMVQTA
jgi:hypothetical protein